MAWLAGAALQLQQAALWPGRWYVVIGLGIPACAGISSILARGHAVASRVSRCLVILALVAAGFAWAGWCATRQAGDALSPALEGRDLRVTGVVEGLPERAAGGWRFVLAVVSAQADGEAVRLPRQVLVSWHDGSRFGAAGAGVPQVSAGDLWRLTLRLRAPHGSANPHGFDYELLMWERGLGAAGYVRTGKQIPPPERLGESGWHPVERLRGATRAAIMATVPDARQAGLIAALTLGDQNAIEPSDWQIFRITGIAHLVSISGLHITMFSWLAAGAIGWLWRRLPRLTLAVPAQNVARVGGVVAATLYALFAGWGVPAQRTVLMLATVAVLRLAGVRWPWRMVWLASAAVVVAVDPWALMQAGFWLSFVAVGILVASGSDERAADPLAAAGDGGAERRSLWRRLAGHVVNDTRTQILITLALAPLTLLLFQQVSLVGLIANAFAIPWVTFLVTPLALLGGLWHPLWHAAAWSSAWLVSVLEVLAKWPAAVWEGAAPPWIPAAAAVAGGALLVLRLPWGIRASALVMSLPAFLWHPPRPATGQFDLVALDIGQGSAVLVRTAAHSMLYDTGPQYSNEADAGERVIVPYLRATGEHLDLMVVSHVDTDHAGGAASVLAAHPETPLLASAEPEHRVWSLTARSERCVAGMGWVWDGVRFEVVHPFEPAGDEPLPSRRRMAKRSTNAQSCVIRVVAAAQGGVVASAALLTGDVEAAQEARLVAAYGEGKAAGQERHVSAGLSDEAAATGATLFWASSLNRDERWQPALTADVLLVPHHGSRGSSSDVFLAAVKPRWALVQAGYRNRYGHPAPATLERYAKAGIPVVDTVGCGAVGWASARPGATTCERQDRRRYWHHGHPGGEP